MEAAVVQEYINAVKLGATLEWHVDVQAYRFRVYHGNKRLVFDSVDEVTAFLRGVEAWRDKHASTLP